MESNSSPSVNLLAYLRSKSSIDYDALSLQVATDLGPFVDCTSNQWEAYSQLSNGENAALVRESVDLARRLELADVSVKELAVEIAMIRLSLRVAPLISGSIHVMCNPLYSWDTEQVFETGHRFHKLCRILDPDFELSRLVMKVPSTWQGLRACGRLGADGIKTLATTLFTMEQVVLAGEAGCVSVSPFAHELRAHLDPSWVISTGRACLADRGSYHDSAPVLDLVSRAQQYYRQHGIPTKVKACALMTTDEIISLAGVDAMTLPAEVLRELASLTDSQEGLEARSVFRGAAPAPVPRLSYMDDEAGFLRAFTANGRGKAKTEDALAIFCGFQMQAEELMTSEMED